jgi:hypothetical protein
MTQINFVQIDDTIKHFADDKQMFESVKRYIMEYIEKHRGYDLNKTNEQLGEEIRAGIQSIEIIQNVFQEMQKYRTIEEKKSSNPAY